MGKKSKSLKASKSSKASSQDLPRSLLDKCSKKFHNGQRKGAYHEWIELIQKTENGKITEVNFQENNKQHSMKVDFQERFKRYLQFAFTNYDVFVTPLEIISHIGDLIFAHHILQITDQKSLINVKTEGGITPIGLGMVSHIMSMINNNIWSQAFSTKKKKKKKKKKISSKIIDKLMNFEENRKCCDQKMLLIKYFKKEKKNWYFVFFSSNYERTCFHS